MSQASLKKELKHLEKEHLVELVLDIYKRSKEAKAFLDFFVDPNEKELFEKYKSKVYEAFYPKKGYKVKIAQGKKAISEFKKFETSADLQAELMLYFVATGVELSLHYGYLTQGFFTSQVKMLDTALRLMKSEELLKKYQSPVLKILEISNQGYFQYSDALHEIYQQYYDENELDDKFEEYL
jgi:hypothetical protein